MILEDNDKLAGILRESIEKYQYEVVRVREYTEIKGEFVRVEPAIGCQLTRRCNLISRVI